MASVVNFKSKEDKLRQAIRDAVAGQEQKAPHKPFYIAVITTLIGTTIPYLTLSFCFAIFFFISTLMLINSLSKHGAKASKKFLSAFLIVLTLATLSGCGPLLADKDQALVDLCQEQGACKTGTSLGFNIAGITIKEASVEEAQAAGEVSNRVATEVGKGYGLIGITKIVVYGS